MKWGYITVLPTSIQICKAIVRKPSQEETAVAQQMAQNAVRQQQTQHSKDPDSKNR